MTGREVERVLVQHARDHQQITLFEDHMAIDLITYSTRLNKQGVSKHVPLKYALQEFAGNRAKLLELLATVHEAAKT